MLIPYIKLAIVFIAMLIGIRFRLGLTISVLAGSFLMAMLFSISPAQWLELSLGIFTDTSILIVWSVIILILSLSSLMESSKQAERFMAALAYRIKSPRIRMVFFPILIGLLPMPGGAVFSAPMINAVAKELPMPEQSKSNINYWFRHTAEMSWPLYPAMILAAGMGGMSTPKLIMWTTPISFIYFCIGWFFFVRPYKFTPQESLACCGTKGSWKTICTEGAPLIVAIAGAICFEICFAFFLPQLPLDYGVILALILALILCHLQNGLGIKDFLRTVAKPSVRSMILMVGALGVFKNIISEGGIVQTLVSHDADITAAWVCAIVLPMAIGALTGLMMAAVGSAFPLLVALVEMSQAGPIGPWLMLGLVSTAVGAMVSPLHICIILSSQYFKVSLSNSVRMMIIPSTCLMVAGIIYFIILRTLF